MHAIRLEGENVGPWQGPFAFDFTLGSIGIFGKNGAGKSTLVDLMYASLTNEWTRIAPVKLDVINNQAAKRAPAWVQFTFMLGGVTCKVRRGIKPAGHELVVGAARPLTNEKEIAQELAKLGVDGKLLGQCVFLEQNCIHEFLELPPGERAKVYQALNHTGDCEDIYAVLTEMLNKDKDLCVAIEDNSDELGQRLGVLDQKLEDLEGQDQQQQGALLSEKNHAAAKKMIDSARRYDVLVGRRPSLEADLAKAELAAKAAVELDAEEQEKLQALVDAEASHRPEYEAARDALRRWDQYAIHCRLKAKREEEMAQLGHSLEKEPPPLEEDDAQVVEYRSQVGHLQRKLEDACKIVRLFVAEKKVQCPTCNTKVAHLTDLVTQAQADSAQLPAQINRLKDRIDAIDTAREWRAKYDNWKEVQETKLKGVSDALVSMTEQQQPVGDKTALALTVKVFEANLTTVELVRSKLKKLTPDAAAKKATMAALRKQLTDLEAEMQTCAVDPDKLRAVQERMRQHDAATAIIANLKGQISQVEEEKANVTETLDRLRARIARAAKIKSMVAILERVRDAAHRNALPQRVAQVNLNRMEGAINKGLELFGSPFWVETQDNLDFLVHKPGEPGQKVQQTSIGQRVLLAIAFWGASHSLYHAELGMLVLDEPSANLDAENRKYLAEAIARLTKRVRDNRQVIVISHAEELHGSFDQVINLDKRS